MIGTGREGSPPQRHAGCRPPIRHFQTMTYDIKQFIALAHGVSSHAATGTLAADTALQFCRVVLPALLAELEIAQRVSERLESAFPVAAACEATICSSRWNEPAAAKPEKAIKKKAAKKARKKKGVKDDRDAS